MTAATFITHVKAKLNRLDSSAYEDVRPEEVLFFAGDALKKLILHFDTLRFSNSVQEESLFVYLASVTKSSGEVAISSGMVTLPQVLKFKDLEAFVTVPETSETGWMPTRELHNIKTSDRVSNPFLQSYPDTPCYRLIDNKIKFDSSPIFTVSKIRYEYLELPAPFTSSSVMEYPFNSELEDTTVTLILENLESRRQQSQPIISMS